MSKIIIIATLMFLAGLGLVAAGMLGFGTPNVLRAGSILIFVALGLRVISTLWRS
ncbi:MAG: hypothetical protein MSG64_14945 [Pyrinomonadaceae bacterium MAG19_C2-C3]|nr:hypothetical protein [Pyrinomonadaceae bacterium MAG19_C2-C3]